jgi:hypothetical protein
MVANKTYNFLKFRNNFDNYLNCIVHKPLSDYNIHLDIESDTVFNIKINII